MKIIEVTKEHIQKGRKEIVDSCPIALALRQQLKWKKNTLVVWGTYVSYTDQKSRVRYEADLPRSAQRFISNFDKGNSVKPFKFKLSL